MKTYSITIKNQFLNAWQILLLLVIFIIIGKYSIEQSGDSQTTISTLTFIFLFELLPQVALHLNYYLVNRYDKLMHDSPNGKFIFYHRGNECEFDVDEICKVVVYKSFALYKNNIQLLAWDYYNHTIIHLNNGKSIVVTSLMVGSELSLQVEKNIVEIKTDFYRWVSGNSLRQK